MKSCDIVEDGALTNNLTATASADMLFKELVSQPGFAEYLESNKGEFPELEQAFSSNQTTAFEKFKKLFVMSKEKDKPAVQAAAQPATPAVVTPDEAPSETISLESLSAKMVAFEKKQTEQDSLIASQKTSMAEKDNTIVDLNAKIAALAAEPAATETTFESGTDAGKKVELKSYHKDPITQKAIERYGK